MEITYDKVKTENRNMQSFQKAITEMRIDDAKKKVRDSHARVEDFKMLTLNIMSACKDSSSKNRTADVFEAWFLDLRKDEWQEDLVRFCRAKGDIAKALGVKNAGKEEFIIIMDDSSVDSVLDYNEFAFGLREKHKEIHDFMVLDVNTSKGIEQMYEEVNVLYER